MRRRYRLKFTHEFLRRFKKLERDMQIRVLREIRMLEIDPFIGKRLRGRLSGLLSFRIGDYRVIYEVRERSVIIRTIGHRRHVYRN